MNLPDYEADDCGGLIPHTPTQVKPTPNGGAAVCVYGRALPLRKIETRSYGADVGKATKVERGDAKPKDGLTGL